MSLAIALIAATPAFAEPAMTETPSVMRRAPLAAAHAVQRVPAHAQIDLGSCAAGWCEASWRDRAGYLPARAISGPPADFSTTSPVVAGGRSVGIGAPPVEGGGVTWSGPYVGANWGWQRW